MSSEQSNHIPTKPTKLIRHSPSCFEVSGTSPIRYRFMVTPKTKFLELCDAVSQAGMSYGDLGRVLAVLSAPDADRVATARSVGLAFEG